MMSLLKEWQQRYNLTVLAILHDLNSAALFADRIGLMKQGELVQIGDHTILSEEELLENVYEVNIASQAHPKIAKSQLFLTPKEYVNSGSDSFNSAYNINQDDQLIHVKFPFPLRTVSNAFIGEGISWASQFCNFHVSENYQSLNFKQDLTSLMEERNIPTTQSIAMMTSVKLTDGEVVKETIESYSYLVIVTAGTDCAVDICQLNSLEPMTIGTINIMVFVDGHLSDGDLLYALQACTEAKTKALFDLRIVDKTTDTYVTGTLTDSVLIAATQQGEPKHFSGNDSVLGKGIGKAGLPGGNPSYRK